jgi:thioredoxin reductase (NADPH)
VSSYYYLYLGVFIGIVGLYLRSRQKKHALHEKELLEAQEGGMNEPPSLHPVVDKVRCIGSGACVPACPEGAIGVIGGKAVLVNAASCIGHGACAGACPVEALALVFGTEKRGVDIPAVTPEFESNVPGIYIAGELGGMGLIRKAAEQGRQAVAALSKKAQAGRADFDVVIVGCGPAGISAGLAAIEHKLRYKLIEQEESMGGAVYHYPRQKVTMTAPVELALVGKVRFEEVQKEKLLEFWQGVVDKTGLKVSFREQMEGIDRQKHNFLVRTSKGNYTANTVLLAMGRRGTPRKLGVPGEDTSRVAYRLIDPAQYVGKAVLVVGGGDSALEAAIALAAEEDTTVTLSYRSEAFSRVKQRNRTLLAQYEQLGRVKVLLKTQVTSITDTHAHIEHEGGLIRVACDTILVCAGGLLPTPLLQQIGIQFSTKYGTR